MSYEYEFIKILDLMEEKSIGYEEASQDIHRSTLNKNPIFPSMKN